MKLKRIIAFILCAVMITGIAPLSLFDIKVSAADSVAKEGNLAGSGHIYTLDTDGIDSGSANGYLLVASDTNRALGVVNNVNTRVPGVSVNISDNGNTIITDNRNNEYYFEASNNAFYIRRGNYYFEHYYYNLRSVNSATNNSAWTVSHSGDGRYSFSNFDNSTWYIGYNVSSNSAELKDTLMVSTSQNNRIRLYKYTGPNNGSSVVFTVSSDAVEVIKGDTCTINGTVTVDGREVPLSDCSITWTSNDGNTAIVNNGFVRGLKKGETTINATLTAVNGTALVAPVTHEITVTVTPRPEYNEEAVIADLLERIEDLEKPENVEAEYVRYTATNGTPAIEDGKYIITQDGTGTQTSNTNTKIMDITAIPRSGSFGIEQVGISDNRIQTSTDYELNFERVNGNSYHITNNDGQYLTIGTGNSGSSYNYQLSFSSAPMTLNVGFAANGNVYIYRSNGSTNIRIDHYSAEDWFSTWIAKSSGDENQRMRLFRYESMVSVKAELYNKLTQAIAIEKGEYSDETFGALLNAIQNGVDSYNHNTSDVRWQEAIDRLNDAISKLDVPIATFGATLYKYGYTPGRGYGNSGNEHLSNQDYNSGGYDFNEISQQEMFEKIMNTPELLDQIEDIADRVNGNWSNNNERQSAIEKIAKEYAKIYTLDFVGLALASGGTSVNNIYDTFWNIWVKPGTTAAGEDGNKGASVQGLYSTTLDENGLPGTHAPYFDALPYINTAQQSDPSHNNDSVAGLHENITTDITKGGSSKNITLSPLSNIAVHVPDFFSRNDILSGKELSNPKETYAKYYWDVQFPFLESINEHGVHSYVYDSHDVNRVFQAGYDDENHIAYAQLTKTKGDEGEIFAPNGENIVTGFFPFNYTLNGSNADMSQRENGVYHYGMSFTTEFFIPPSGHYGEDKSDIVFEFSGDDDVLVYIDDVLVLDNGGIHGARTAHINFTEKSVLYQYVADVETGTVVNGNTPGSVNEGIVYKYGEENQNISAEDLAAIEYLNKIATDGQQHTFTFYYLERGSTLSNCKISFNMQKISDHVKLTDQTYVVDYGLPVEYDITKNNVLSVPDDDYEMPEYEYIGVTATLPETANSLIMFREPTEDEIRYFQDGQYAYDGKFSNYVFKSDGKILFTPDTMSYTGSGTMYYCARVTNDATYTSDTVYYMFEKITIVPATIIYYEDDFVGDAVTYTDGTIPSGEANTNNYGIWQTATSTIPTDIVKDKIYQHVDEVGAVDTNIYGYDQAYTDCATYSGYTSSYVTVSAKNNPSASYSGGEGSSWPKAEFTFAGTGFDLISVTSKDTGAVQVVVKDADGNQVKNHTVNTYYGYSYGQLYRDSGGNTTLEETNTPLYFNAIRDYTETPMYYDANGVIVTRNTGNPAYAMGWVVDNGIEGDNSLYQIPVIKVEDLPYGSYTVTITPMYSSRMDMMSDGAYDFYLDAIRIYNPAGIGETLTDPTISYVYTADNEANPDYLELRNMLIGSNKLTDDGAAAEGIVFIDGINENADVSKYTSAGPNNELYLLKDQAVAFEIWASAIPDEVDIGVKAVGNSTATMKLSCEHKSHNTIHTGDIVVRTSTDLYYSVDEIFMEDDGAHLIWTRVPGTNFYTSGTIVLQNISDGILSVTNLVLTFPSAGIGYYENLERIGDSVDEDVMVMSDYSTFTMARSALRMVYADLEITEDDVTVENSSVMTDESIVVKVETSTDVDSLVIKDENGNVITPEYIESYVETVDDKDVKQWTVTLSESNAGTYVYTITGVYENGFESESGPVVITVTVNELPVPEEEENVKFLDKLVGFFKYLIDFFRQLVKLFTAWSV